jgi:hypothetical protein
MLDEQPHGLGVESDSPVGVGLGVLLEHAGPGRLGGAALDP